jgi:hypothetical protein
MGDAGPVPRTQSLVANGVGCCKQLTPVGRTLGLLIQAKRGRQGHNGGLLRGSVVNAAQRAPAGASALTQVRHLDPHITQSNEVRRIGLVAGVAPVERPGPQVGHPVLSSRIPRAGRHAQ